MPLKEPVWWYGAGTHRLALRLLSPLSNVYGSIAEARYRRHEPYRSTLPVICIGNFTAGGTGKTPLTRFVMEHLASLGERPVCLSRGYGGRLSGPVWVDPTQHRARDVGDEALMLARRMPVVVAKDRREGARAIEAATPKATAIVMDDGLQNPALAKDLTIAVVDVNRGMGNGHVIPAGPLRAPLAFQLGLVDCVVVNGTSEREEVGAEPVFERFKHSFPGPVLRARAKPDGEARLFQDLTVAAYAGIGNPERFFRTLEELGARLMHKATFADHHEISEREAEHLLARARDEGAKLVTTEKDKARLAGATGRRAELLSQSDVLAIKTVFDERDESRMHALVEAVRMRKGRSS